MNRSHYTVGDLLESHGKALQLEPVTPHISLVNRIQGPALHRPGLSLTGYGLRKVDRRILLFGRVELEFLKTLDEKKRKACLKGVITEKNPVVIISRGLIAPKALIEACKTLNIPVLKSGLKSMELLTKLTMILSDVFAPTESVHATLVEAFGIGVLLMGESSVGKSETALGLIEKGHRLISDDVVRIRKKENDVLVGSGPKLNRHLLEIRGIGIINVANLFGAVCVKTEVKVDMVINLEEWNAAHFYDRVGLEEKFTQILDVNIPTYMLPVKPGRDMILLIETTILNHRLKNMGYHSAKEFNEKLLEEIAKRKKGATSER